MKSTKIPKLILSLKTYDKGFLKAHVYEAEVTGAKSLSLKTKFKNNFRTHKNHNFSPAKQQNEDHIDSY